MLNRMLKYFSLLSRVSMSPIVFLPCKSTNEPIYVALNEMYRLLKSGKNVGAVYFDLPSTE